MQNTLLPFRLQKDPAICCSIMSLNTLTHLYYSLNHSEYIDFSGRKVGIFQIEIIVSITSFFKMDFLG